MRESSFWRSIKAGLEKETNKKIFLQRHEDRALVGLPDIYYCISGYCGWIELKYFPDKFSALRIAQKLWMKRYMEAGGNVWLLARVKNDIYLVHGKQAVGLLNRASMSLSLSAKNYWNKKINFDELLQTLVIANEKMTTI